MENVISELKLNCVLQILFYILIKLRYLYSKVPYLYEYFHVLQKFIKIIFP